MNLNFEIGNYGKPNNKNMFLSEKDKEFFLNDNLDSTKLFIKPKLYSISISASKEVQDYEKSLELKLKTKFNC